MDNFGITSLNPGSGLESPSGTRTGASSDARGRKRCRGVAKSTALRWPSLGTIGLSDDQRSERGRGLGGSDANILLSGDKEKILQLWRMKRGEAEDGDLSNVLAVMLGCWTEPFNRQWFESISGTSVLACGQPFVCDLHDWRRCTVDGLVDPGGAVFEAKHTSAFAKPEEVLERYMPQLQHNMAVTKRERAILSVIFGNHKYETFEIAADWLYQQELLDAEAAFWDCVLIGREPVPADMPAAPKPIGVREVSFEGHNAWAFAAVEWLDYRDGAKKHAAAAGLIKSLIEEDVARAFGHGVEAKRSKSGAITIREIVQ